MDDRVCLSPAAVADLPAKDYLAMVRRIGARHAGIYTHQVIGPSRTDVLHAIRDSGVQISYLVHRIGAIADWEASRRLLEAAIDLAPDLGVPFLYTTTGAAGAARFEGAASEFGRRMEPLVERARDVDLDLALESTHVLRSDLSFVFSYRDTVRLARDVGMCVVLDLFPTWIEPDLAATVGGSLDILRMVQVSDFVLGSTVQPNRWVPGDGDLPLSSVLRDLLDVGYTGRFDIELLGAVIRDEGVERALSRGAGWLDRTLQALDAGAAEDPV